MEPSKAVKEYKEQIKELEKKVDKYAKTVASLRAKGLGSGKAREKDLSTKRRLVQADNNETLSNAKKHELLI